MENIKNTEKDTIKKYIHMIHNDLQILSEQQTLDLKILYDMYNKSQPKLDKIKYEKLVTEIKNYGIKISKIFKKDLDHLTKIESCVCPCPCPPEIISYSYPPSFFANYIHEANMDIKNMLYEKAIEYFADMILEIPDDIKDTDCLVDMDSHLFEPAKDPSIVFVNLIESGVSDENIRARIRVNMLGKRILAIEEEDISTLHSMTYLDYLHTIYNIDKKTRVDSLDDLLSYCRIFDALSGIATKKVDNDRCTLKNVRNRLIKIMSYAYKSLEYQKDSTDNFYNLICNDDIQKWTLYNVTVTKIVSHIVINSYINSYMEKKSQP